mmetsp:Transcript_7911/g.17497  ORF Transcript_7911/g.17497 Transcript_7911/m.17497 type:complete len:295 (-) Transcript_7911:602-1486(-)
MVNRGALERDLALGHEHGHCSGEHRHQPCSQDEHRRGDLVLSDDLFFENSIRDVASVQRCCNQQTLHSHWQNHGCWHTHDEGVHDNVDVPAYSCHNKEDDGHHHGRHIDQMHLLDSQDHGGQEECQSNGRDCKALSQLRAEAHAEGAVWDQDVLKLASMVQTHGIWASRFLAEVRHVHHSWELFIRDILLQELAERLPAIPHIVDEKLRVALRCGALAQDSLDVVVVLPVIVKHAATVHLGVKHSQRRAPREAQDFAELVVGRHQESFDAPQERTCSEWNPRKVVIHVFLGALH